MGTKSPGLRQVYTSALVAPEVAAAPETSSFCKMKTPCWPGSNLGALTQATSRESGQRRTILFLLSFGPSRMDRTCSTAPCQLALCLHARYPGTADFGTVQRYPSAMRPMPPY